MWNVCLISSVISFFFFIRNQYNTLIIKTQCSDAKEIEAKWYYDGYKIIFYRGLKKKKTDFSRHGISFTFLFLLLRKFCDAKNIWTNIHGRRVYLPLKEWIVFFSFVHRLVLELQVKSTWHFTRKIFFGQMVHKKYCRITDDCTAKFMYWWQLVATYTYTKRFTFESHSFYRDELFARYVWSVL